MKKLVVSLLLIASLASACNFSGGRPTATDTPTLAASTQPMNTATAIPPTTTPLPTSTPAASLGTIVLDFTALLCDAEWMNGAVHLKTCPPSGSDQSGGYAILADPVTEGLPDGTPAILTFAGSNSAAIFLRYPTLTVHNGDHFRAGLRCEINIPCDVQFALEYFDTQGKYHSPFLQWNYKAGDPAIEVDADLSSLAGQSVYFMLALRPQNTASPQQNGGLWIAPYIYRPTP
jgi:hypothetical protein